MTFTTEGMNVAGSLSESPWSTGEKVVDQLGKEANHQTHIAGGQVHNEHVGRSTQRRAAAEDAQHAVVAERGDGSCREQQLPILSTLNSDNLFILPMDDGTYPKSESRIPDRRTKPDAAPSGYASEDVRNGGCLPERTRKE